MKKKTQQAQEPELAKKYQHILHEQVIDEHSPGTIVQDFGILLKFVETEVPKVSKKNNLLPIKALTPLNAQLSNPLQIDLKRPQQKSYPHINGLYMLLRATGLGYIKGSGAKLHLALDDAVLKSWKGLNPTERYCTLLEAWLQRSSPQMIGERGGWVREHPIYKWRNFFERMKGQELKVSGNKDADVWLSYTPGLYNLALLELFGCVSITHGKPETGKGWKIMTIRKTPFGEAMLNVFLPPKAPTEDILDVMLLSMLMPDEDDEDVDETFGQLQSKLQPYFQEWKNNLAITEPAIQEGTYIFKVSLGSPWRRIAIPGDMVLDHLSGAILHAFDFDQDHLYSFICKDRFGCELHINHPYVQDAPFTSEVEVQEVPLHVGGSMTFVFDFGDNWQFNVLLERIDPVDPKLKNSKVLDKKGEAPEQYPMWDDEW